MREIKFRIFDKQEEEFLNEEDYAINFVGTIFKACLDEEVFEVLDADMYIVTQCTGLKDRNGNEIYEGDIVKHLANDKILEIVFREDDVEFSAKEHTKYLPKYYNFRKDMANNRLQVIGNIYNNPELLNNHGN